MEIISEKVLIDYLKNEEKSSYALLYKLYFPSIASYVKKNHGNNHDAEDIFQDSLIVLLHKLRETDFILTSSVKTYLYAVAKNLWLKRVRDNRLQLLSDDNQLIINNEDTVALTFELTPPKSKEQLLQGWLLGITERCQQILRAIFFLNEPMESLMIKMDWKNRHSSANQKYKCIEQIKKQKERDEK